MKINWKQRYSHRVLPWPFLPKEIEGHLEIHHNGDVDYADLGDVVDAYRSIYHDTGMHKHMMFDEFLHGRHDNLHKRIETNHSHPNQASVLPSPSKPSQLRLHIHTQHGSSSQHLNDVLTDEELLWFHDEEHESENNNHTHLKTAEKVFPKYNEDDKNSYIHLHMHHGMPMSAIAEMHYMLTNEQHQMDESKRLKQLPNESPLDFVHRWVHEVRGGEWNMDNTGHEYDNHKHATKRTLPDVSGSPEATRLHVMVEHGISKEMLSALADDPWHGNHFTRKDNESDAEFVHRLDHYVTDNPARGSRHIHVERRPGNIYTPDHGEYGNGQSFQAIDTSDI